MKKVLAKIKNGLLRYRTFCRSCIYFRNEAGDAVFSNMGAPKYALTYLLLMATIFVAIFTGRTQLPDGTQVSMDIFFTNWHMWTAALALLIAISTRSVQSRLTPMSYRRRTVYYLLRPLLISAAVVICIDLIIILIGIFAAIVNHIVGAPAEGESVTTPLYILCPSGYLWHFSAILFSFSVALLIPAIKRSWHKYVVCAGALAFFYVLSLVAINLSQFKPNRGLEFFSNPIIALEYLPEWLGWLFAGTLAAAAIALCVLAIVFTCRECKPKAF